MYIPSPNASITGPIHTGFPLHLNEAGQLVTLTFDVNNIKAKVPVPMDLGWCKGKHVMIVGVALTRLPSSMLATTTQYAFEFHWDQMGVIKPQSTSTTTGNGLFSGYKTSNVLFTFPITTYIMANSSFLWDFQLEAPTDFVNFWVTYNDNQEITVLTTGTDVYFKLFLTLWIHP